MREVPHESLPAWLQESGVLRADLGGDAREYATQIAARRLVREYIEPVAKAAAVDQVQGT